MKIEKTTYKGCADSYRLVHGDAEMIVVTQFGPRILSLSVGGENLLFEDDGKLQRGDWLIYGGHRVWVSPETEQTYAPDNAPCEAVVEGETLLVTGPANPDTKLRPALRISAEGERFVVDNLITNTGEMVQTGGVWALTCVAPTGKVCFPWGRPGAWHLKKIVYWNNWSTHTSDVTSRQWRPGPDLFVIDPTGEEGKVGTANYEGWIALSRPDATFIKTFEHIEGATYPDDNCSMEAYTCDLFIEMETLSPSVTFYPGETTGHREHWLATKQAVDVSKPETVRALLKG